MVVENKKAACRNPHRKFDLVNEYYRYMLTKKTGTKIN